jgi:hypothetical protein
MKSISIALHEATLAKVKAESNGKAPGNTLNNILSEYSTPDAIAEAVARHLRDPVVDPTPIKRTSIYMTERWMDNLRAFINKTYLPVDATVRILVQDYLQHRSKP